MTGHKASLGGPVKVVTKSCSTMKQLKASEALALRIRVGMGPANGTMLGESMRTYGGLCSKEGATRRTHTWNRVWQEACTERGRELLYVSGVTHNIRNTYNAVKGGRERGAKGRPSIEVQGRLS